MSSSTSLAPLALVERKLASARLVQAALSRLIQQTEAVAAPSSASLGVEAEDRAASSGAATPQSAGTGTASEPAGSAQKPKKLALRLRTSISSSSNPLPLTPLTPAARDASLAARTMPPPPPLPASAGLPGASSTTLPMAGPASAGPSLVMRRKSVLLQGEEDAWGAAIPRGWPGAHGEASSSSSSAASSAAAGLTAGLATTPGPGTGALHTPGAQFVAFPGAAAGMPNTPGLGTPLLGTPFAYPPTPGDAYASWAPVGAVAGGAGAMDAAEAPLPKAVNYRAAQNGARRSWRV